MTFSKDITEKIIDGMIGGLSLNKTCESEGMPHPKTVMRWLAKGRQEEGTEHADFATQYELAQELRQERQTDEINERAAEKVPDEVLSQGTAAIHAWSNRQKLIVDTLKWTASRLLSKRYGDKIQHTGADDGPIVTTIERIIVHEKDPQSTDTNGPGL